MIFEDFVKLHDNVKLFYKVYSPSLKSKIDKDLVTLIYLHGGPGLDHTIHEPFWSKYFPEYQIILPDLRGQGRSDPSDKSKWNLKQWAEDLYEFCNALEIKNPIIAGASFGGHVILQYAIDYPEQPGGLILINTEAKQDFQEMLDAYERAGGKQAKEAAREVFTNINNDTLKTYQEICAPLFQNNPVIKDDFFNCILRLEVTQHYNQKEHFKFNFLPHLKNIKCKTLVITGDIGSLHRKENAEKLAAALPSEIVELKCFKGAGTPVFNHYPAEVSDAIKLFVISALES